jgi:hypothetical protein
MKRKLFSLWLFVLAVCFTTNIRAQVTLGNTNGIPKPAEKFSAVEIISKGTGGLRLPQLSTTERNAWTLSGIALANGLTIYNTTTKCVEYWNSERWISMCEGTSQTTISPAACANVAANGTGCDQTFTVEDPDCPNGPFTIAIVAGNDYASLTDVSTANGTFKIRFNENNSVSTHSVMVRVTSSCTSQYKDFMFTQAGVDCSTYNYTVPAISPSGSALSLCTGGAVYLSVPATTANLDKLIWTRNGVEVARGQSYYIATQIGTYNVSMGAIGCNTNAANERKITESGTAPAQIKTIVASNSGILCGTSGTVKLTAMGSTGAVSWFHNGVLDSARTGSTITLTGSADQGDWFAAAGSAGCYSKNSNVINVTYEAGSGTPIVVNNADVLVNGTAINAVTTFCQGGSLTLEVKNKQAGVTYTWYNGDAVITSPYTIPADQTSILLRMVATDNSGVACPAEASTTEKPISGGKAPDAPTISGSGVICKDSTDLSVVPAVAGTYTYTWYEGSTKLSQTTQTITVNKTGTTYSATVTNASGCVSPMGSKTTGAAVSDVPTLTWKTAPTPVNYGDVKVYVTNIDYDLNTTYVWKSDNTDVVITPAGASASVKFPSTGTGGAIINLTVTATNSCGASAPLVLPITVGNSCPTPVVSAQSATTFASAVAGTPVTLQVSATGTNTPTYQWYTGTAPSGSAISGANSATYIYTPSATGTVNLYCVVTNGCDATAKGTSPAFTVTTTINPIDYPTTATLSMSGKVCFDTRETFDVNNNGLSVNRTDTSSPLPKGTQDYVLTVTGKTISTVTWVASVTKFYSNTVASGTNNTTYTVTFADLETIIKPAVENSTKATVANGQVITITAYVTFTDGTKGSISKVVKIQDFMCCDGYVCVGCAYDYLNGAPGDWALTAASPSNSVTSIPNVAPLGPQAYGESTTTFLNKFFKTTSSGDLCVYKKDVYTLGNTPNWAQAIKACQNGTVVDGSAGIWYLPNVRELYAVYLKFSNNGAIKPRPFGTPTDFGGAPDAAGMNISSNYSTSTEYNGSVQTTFGFEATFDQWPGKTFGAPKDSAPSLVMRCVRRM